MNARAETERVTLAAAIVRFLQAQRTDGKQGFISAQVSPKHWRDPAKMLAHAQELVALAPNVAIKAPSTAAGIEAMEEMAPRAST